MHRLRSAISFVLISAILCGCRTTDDRSFGFGYAWIANFPNTRAIQSIAITPEELDIHRDLPSGTYYDQNQAIIVSGYEKSLGTTPPWWLGPGVMIGLAIAGYSSSDDNRLHGKALLGGGTQISAANIRTLTEQLLDKELAAGRAPLWSKATGAASLQVHPYAVFRILPSGKARLYAMLRVTSSSQPIWSGRYFARAPGEYEIQGDDGWRVPDRINHGIAIALQRALDACIDDTSGSLTEIRKLQMTGIMPFVSSEKRKYRVILLKEGADIDIVRVILSDAWPISGIHVVDVADMSMVEADFDDPRLDRQ